MAEVFEKDLIREGCKSPITWTKVYSDSGADVEYFQLNSNRSGRCAPVGLLEDVSRRAHLGTRIAPAQQIIPLLRFQIAFSGPTRKFSGRPENVRSRFGTASDMCFVHFRVRPPFGL